MEQDRADAFMISDEPEPITYRATIVEFAAKDRLPAIYPFRDYVEVGGLMAYSIGPSGHVSPHRQRHR